MSAKSGRLLWVVAILSAGMSAQARDPLAGKAFDKLRALAGEGRNEEAVVEADALLRVLSRKAGEGTWTLDFQPGMQTAALGQRYVYFAYKPSGRYRPEDQTNRPDLMPKPQHVFAEANRYDWVLAITCVDGQTGKRLWTRHHVPNSHYAVDPRDDTLWVWGDAGRSSLYQIAPLTGDALIERSMPSSQPCHVTPFIRGLRMGNVRFWGFRSPNDSSLIRGAEFDVDTGEYFADVPHPALLSPNRLRVLGCFAPGNYSVRGVMLNVIGPFPGDPIWSALPDPAEGSFPIWIGNDVACLAGGAGGPAFVYRLDGETGKARWRTRLPEGPFIPGTSSDICGGWTAIGEAGRYLLALGGRGTLYFLRPDNGEIAHEVATDMSFLAMPRMVGDRLIIPGSTGLRAVPLEQLLQKPDGTMLQVLSIKARALLSANRKEEALAAAEQAVALYRREPEAWRLMRDVCAGTAHEERALAAEIRLVLETGTKTSDRLQQKYGVLACLKTGPVSTPTVKMGELLLCATTDGALLTVSPSRCEIVEREELDAGVAGLYVQGGSLFVGGNAVPLRTFAGAWPDLEPEDPLIRFQEPQGLPPAFYARCGYDGMPVQIGKKWVRPLHQGRVRIAEDSEVKEFDAELPGIISWQILLTDRGPLGYGSGGVYELDENCRPVRAMISAGTPVPYHSEPRISAIAADRDYLCVLAGDCQQPRLQLWTRDGSRMIREVKPLGNACTCLKPLGDGMLFTGPDLIWIPYDPDRPVWGFRALADPRKKSGCAFFGYPRFFDDRMAVASPSGALFIFSLDAILGTRAPE
jgi:hypothetical protein